jgi:anion-transporting  ArsA/GET3 family ATPase
MAVVIKCRTVARAADLQSKRLIIVAGKGGVGRSTVSAALGVALAKQGKRVLVYQASAKDRLSQMLGGPKVAEHIVCLGENLWAVNTNPSAALHEYGLMVLKYETIYRLVFENSVVRYLLRAIPGLDDYAVIGKMWWHTTEEEDGEPRWDTVIFDAPATGHLVTMLKIPQVILEAVPEGPLVKDAKKVHALLHDPARTAVVLTTLAEEMPTCEALELHAKIRGDLQMNVSHLVVNQLYPDRFAHEGIPARVLDALPDEVEPGRFPSLAVLLERARTLRTRRAINDRYLARLGTEAELPLVRLPFLFRPTLGKNDIEKLATLLAEQAMALGKAA